MTTKEIEYRESTLDDLDIIAKMWVKNADYHSELDQRFVYVHDALPHTAGYFKKQFESGKSRPYVATLDGNVIAYIWAQIMDTPPIRPYPQVGFIDGLYVSEDYRRHGIATQLVQLALSWFKENSITTINLTVAFQNPAAIAFWRRIGFKELMFRMQMDLA